MFSMEQGALRKGLSPTLAEGIPAVCRESLMAGGQNLDVPDAAPDKCANEQVWNDDGTTMGPGTTESKTVMHEFLTANRRELIDLCERKVAGRSSQKVARQEVNHGIPLFLDQLIKTLQIEQTADPMKSREVSGPADGHGPARSEVAESAAIHGQELLHRGFTIEQVVHEYGDLCQAVTELAFQKRERIEIEEFQTLNRCLDNAIAVAVTEFNYQRDAAVASRHAESANQRLGSFGHDLHNLLNTATLALTAIKAGHVGVVGATGTVLDAALVGMRSLINHSLTDLRTSAGVTPTHKLFSLADFINDVGMSGANEALVKKRILRISSVDRELAVDADRDLLLSAVGSLLARAFDAKGSGSEVTLNAYGAADRILIEVEDKGLRPDTDSDPDLLLSRQGVEASGGVLSTRDDRGGSLVTISLPRHDMAGKPVVPRSAAIH